MKAELMDYAYDVNCPEELAELLRRKYYSELRIKSAEREMVHDEKKGTTEDLEHCYAERANAIAELDQKYPHWNDEQARELYCKAESTT